MPSKKTASKKTASKKAVKFVVMVRDGRKANIHPNEVDNYAKNGYVTEG